MIFKKVSLRKRKRERERERERERRTLSSLGLCKFMLPYNSYYF